MFPRSLLKELPPLASSIWYSVIIKAQASSGIVIKTSRFIRSFPGIVIVNVYILCWRSFLIQLLYELRLLILPPFLETNWIAPMGIIWSLAGGVAFHLAIPIAISSAFVIIGLLYATHASVRRLWYRWPLFLWLEFEIFLFKVYAYRTEILLLLLPSSSLHFRLYTKRIWHWVNSI